MVICVLLFVISAFTAFYAMVGYPIVLLLIDKLKKPQKHSKDYGYEPTISYMITAHNEEEIIQKKLENSIEIDYPKEKIEILVVLDNCTDNTEIVVDNFIYRHPEYKIRKYHAVKHLGKLNAQNEAQKTIKSELIVMTDANTMVKKNAIRELAASFTSDDIAYVCGKLSYINQEDNLTGDSESTYWNLELKIRDIESRLKKIENGNGALYACKNKAYVDFEPIRCHDSAMPYYFAMHGKRAIFNPEAIAEERPGQSNNDEFDRKVRMNREFIHLPARDLKTINIFKYGWFSFIYFGHKTCRHNLWLAHLIALLSSVVMAVLKIKIGIVLVILQLLFFIVTLCQIKVSVKNRFIRMAGYYGMTVLAQFVAIYKGITGQSKPTWEKVDSTRQ